MPQEQIYQPQVAPGGTAGVPMASPQDFGAGVGQGIAELGGALHRHELDAYKIERQQRADAQAADFNARFAQAREDADKASIDARTNAAPGGAGHAEAMAKWWADRKATLTDGITEDSLRRSATAQIDQFGASFETQAYQFQEGARIGKVSTDTQSAADISAARARRDPTAYHQELGLAHAAIMSMVGVPADVKDKLLKHYDETSTVGYFEGWIDRDPKQVAAQLDSGAYDTLISAPQAERLRNAAEARIHMNDAAARADAAHAIAVAREQLGKTEVQLRSGGGSYDDRLKLAAQFDAMGDYSKAEEWRGEAVTFKAATGTGSWNLEDQEAKLAELDAKRNSGGLSPTEANFYKGLKQQHDGKVERLAKPGGALVDLQYSGVRLTPLDPNNPASFAKRASDATIAAQRAKRLSVEPLLPSDIPTYKDLATGTPAQQLQAIDMLKHFDDPRVIAGAARQIAKDSDGAFRIAALLQHDVARDVLIGDETLRQRPQIWNQNKARKDFDSWYGPAVARVGGGFGNDIFEAAKRFYAQRADDGHGTDYDPGKFAEAIETVLGRTQQGGAVVGGVARDVKGNLITIAPRDMNPNEMLQTFARAAPLDYAHAAGGHAPRYADGSPMGETFFKTLRPTFLTDGIYGFRDASGRLVHDDKGGTYAVDIYKLPKR